MPSPIRAACLATLAVLAGAGMSPAQHRPSPHLPPAPALDEIFAVRTFGAFRDMVQKRDYAGKVVLSGPETAGATEAVGAIAGLRGEITMVDGRTILSYGNCPECKAPPSEAAALLGIASVRAWAAPVPLPEDLAGAALSEFILAQAKAAGLDPARPFPVRLAGTLLNVAMHVNEAPNDGFTGHGSRIKMAKQQAFEHAILGGIVVGFYAPPSLAGIITHPGEPFHFHWADDARTRTAHLDAFGMKKGSILLLPAR